MHLSFKSSSMLIGISRSSPIIPLSLLVTPQLASAFNSMSAPLLETTSLALLHTRDVNKDLTPKDQDKDKDLTPKDQDKDKDLTPKASFESHGRFPKQH